MPRSKIGNRRKPVVQEDLEKAVEQVLDKKMTVYGAAKELNLSKTTLLRHIKAFKEKGLQKFVYNKGNDVKKVFNDEEEQELVEYIKKAACLHYGLTLRDVQVLAYQYAKQNNKQYDKSWDMNKMAGKQWLRSFRKKYADSLSLRAPEATSLARSTSFNRENVSAFFENYKMALEKHPTVSAYNIWNCDETGISTVHIPPKILAKKGIKQVGSMTCAERGQNVTMISAINAGGGFMPPMLIFPRKNFKDYMLKGAPVGSIGGANPSGWSNEDLFLEFLNHFIKHSRSSKENPTILLLDNHESHISIPVFQMAKNYGVTLVTFHPHTSHKMQPLDRGIFGPFKSYYNTAMKEWMMMPGNVGKPATIYDIAELVGKAFPLAFTPSNITNGFKVSGIEPLNENIFEEYEFLPSNVTDRPMPCLEESAAQPEKLGEERPTLLEVDQLNNGPPTASINLQPGTSVNLNDHLTSTSTVESPQLVPSTSQSTASSPRLVSTMKSVVSPEEIRPFPKAQPRKNTRKGRRKGRSFILTDTPVKLQIELEKTAKMLEKMKKTNKPTPHSKDLKTAKKKLIFSSDAINTVKKKHVYSKTAKKKPTYSSDSESDLDLSDLCEESDVSEEDFADLEDPDIEKIQVGVFILVKITTKKTCRYFVADVVSIHKDHYKVQFLKKDLYSEKFTREDNTVYSVEMCDIIFKLPHPIVVGGSARQLEKLTFGVNLQRFNVG